MIGKLRAWFSGRTGPCQGSDSGSIPGARTNNHLKVIFVWAVNAMGIAFIGNRSLVEYFYEVFTK